MVEAFTDTTNPDDRYTRLLDETEEEIENNVTEQSHQQQEQEEQQTSSQDQEDSDSEYEKVKAENVNADQENSSIAVAEPKAVSMDREIDTPSENEVVFSGTGLGMLAGCLCGIPLVGALIGCCYAKHYAKKDCKNGERARQVGEYGLRCKDKAYDAFSYAREYNREHEVDSKVASCVVTSCNKAAKFAANSWDRISQKYVKQQDNSGASL